MTFSLHTAPPLLGQKAVSLSLLVVVVLRKIYPEHNLVITLPSALRSSIFRLLVLIVNPLLLAKLVIDMLH